MAEDTPTTGDPGGDDRNATGGRSDDEPPDATGGDGGDGTPADGADDDGGPSPDEAGDGRGRPADASSDEGQSAGARSDDGEGSADARSDDRQPDDAADGGDPQPRVPDPDEDVPEDVRKYDRFKKVDGAQYERVNEFLRERTYVTAREWAIARLCADFRTETGVEMTKIGENLPELVPFMTDEYTPQAVNQARASFEEKVRKAGATFLYGAMCDFFTAEELDDVMYEATEVAKFLLEVEGVDLSVEEELEAEDRISGVMREVRSASDQLRHSGTECPECGHEIGGDD